MLWGLVNLCGCYNHVRGHPVLPGDAVNGVGVNDFPGEHGNPCHIHVSLQFNHSIKGAGECVLI